MSGLKEEGATARSKRPARVRPDQQGIAKRLKRVLPQRLFRISSRSFTVLSSLLPFRFKYGVAAIFARRRVPYSLLRRTDSVVQIGSARDILRTGRSRAILLSKRVPEGRVLVVEADSDNCAALREYVAKHDISNITVFESGAWEHKGELAFMSSSKHPAANLLADVKSLTAEEKQERAYVSHSISVDTIDNILADSAFPPPRLVSITTNGAEIPILEGMKDTLRSGCEIVSLASTGPDLIDHMMSLGYKLLAHDDRGYCFRRKDRSKE